MVIISCRPVFYFEALGLICGKNRIIYVWKGGTGLTLIKTGNNKLRGIHRFAVRFVAWMKGKPGEITRTSFFEQGVTTHYSDAVY